MTPEVLVVMFLQTGHVGWQPSPSLEYCEALVEAVNGGEVVELVDGGKKARVLMARCVTPMEALTQFGFKGITDR